MRTRNNLQPPPQIQISVLICRLCLKSFLEHPRIATFHGKFLNQAASMDGILVPEILLTQIPRKNYIFFKGRMKKIETYTHSLTIYRVQS